MFGWHYGFAAAGVGMLIGLAIYLAGQASAAAGRTDQTRRRAEASARPRRMAGDCSRIAVLFLPVTLFWATYEQAGNTISLWADAHTDRTINLLFWQGEIPTTWFQAFNPFMIFAFTPFVIGLWAWQARRGREPSTVFKMALGCFGVALANLILVVAAWQAGTDKANWLWLFAFFAVLTLGELYLSPIGLSLVTKIAPARLISTLMGVWLGTSFVGNFLAGYLGSFWSSMDKGALSSR